MWHMKSFAIFFFLFFGKLIKLTSLSPNIYIYIFFYLGKLRDIMRVMGNWMNHVDSF